MRRIVDISVALENDALGEPHYMRPRIAYKSHTDTIPNLLGDFPGLSPEDMPNGEYCAVERVDISTHNGTHLDAPWHHHSTMNNGEPAATIDEIPLDWCFRPAVKLDFRHLPDGHIVSARQVEDELNRVGHDLQPLDIVVVNTRAGAVYGTDEYMHAGCGMGAEATLWLLERGVRVTGIDGWGWDAPFSLTAKKYKETGNPAIIWEGHKASRFIGYCHMEKLHNLELLPSTGFEISCFPIKIKRASAGWTRAVAIIDE